MFARQEVEPRRGEALAPVVRVLEEPRAQVVARLDDPQRLDPGGDDGRGKRVREEVGPRPLPQKVDHRLRRRDIAADRAAQRLAQRAGEDVGADTRMGGRATALGPDETGGVAVVDHDKGVVAVGKRADLGAAWQGSRPSKRRRRWRS